MEVIICTLGLVILVLWYKFSKSIKGFRSEKNSYLEKIKSQININIYVDGPYLF